MGKKSTKQKTTSSTAPSAFSQPFISGAADALKSGFDASTGVNADLLSFLQGNQGKVAANAFDNPLLSAAGGYNTDVLSGKYLNGSPQLDAIVKSTSDDVTDRVNASIGLRGQTGGSSHSGVLSKSLADAENGLRYTDYARERGAMDSAVGSAAGLSNAGNANIATLLQYLGLESALPGAASDDYAGRVASLLGGYNNTTGTGTSTPSTASSIMGGVGTAAKIASLFSDRRLKTEIRKVGEFADGLGRYAWRYIWGGPLHEGVMAEEVAALRPWALGPVRAGFATVDYNKLEAR